MNEFMNLKLCRDCNKDLGDFLTADAQAQLDFLAKPVPEPPLELEENQHTAILVLTCEQFSTLAEIVENGNRQGAMMCDICGSWDWMGNPWECYENYEKCPDTRYITTKDVEAAQVIYIDGCECDCCKE